MCILMSRIWEYTDSVAQLLPKLNVLKQHDNDMINVTQMVMLTWQMSLAW